MSAGRAKPKKTEPDQFFSVDSTEVGDASGPTNAGGELNEKRSEARHAMEGAERRRERELVQKKEREELLRQQQIEIVKKKREILAAQKGHPEIPITAPPPGQWDKYREQINEAKKEMTAIASAPPELAKGRTFSTDIFSNLGATGTSEAKLALQAKEQELSKSSRATAATRKKTRLSLAVWLLGLAFLAGSLVVAYGAYHVYSKRLAGVKAEMVVPLVFAEDQRVIAIDGLTPDEIMSALATAWRGVPSRESLIDIYFTTTTSTEDGRKITEVLPVIDFLAQANLGLPADFVHFLEPKFMTAVYDAPGQNQSHIFIFTTRSFEHTFDILLREGSLITHALFGKLAPPENTFAIRFQPFEDQIINNLDTRVIKNSAGEVIALYAFLDRKTLVFTESPEAFFKVQSAYERGKATATQ